MRTLYDNLSDEKRIAWATRGSDVWHEDQLLRCLENADHRPVPSRESIEQQTSLFAQARRTKRSPPSTGSWSHTFGASEPTRVLHRAANGAIAMQTAVSRGRGPPAAVHKRARNVWRQLMRESDEQSPPAMNDVNANLRELSSAVSDLRRRVYTLEAENVELRGEVRGLRAQL